MSDCFRLVAEITIPGGNVSSFGGGNYLVDSVPVSDDMQVPPMILTGF